MRIAYIFHKLNHKPVVSCMRCYKGLLTVNSWWILQVGLFRMRHTCSHILGLYQSTVMVQAPEKTKDHILPHHLKHIRKWIHSCIPPNLNVNADISCACVWWLKHQVCRCVRPIKHEQWCELPVRGFQVIDFPTCSSAENRIFNLSLRSHPPLLLVKCDRRNVFISQPRISTFSLVSFFLFFICFLFVLWFCFS